MPYSVTSPDQTINNYNLEQYDYDYAYPDGLDLKPGAELHQRILARLLRYGWESSKVISNRKTDWDEMNDKLIAYIPLSEKEKAVKFKDKRKPVSIVFPYSYAILETIISYMVAAFFPDPMFRYEGIGPEDVGGAMLLEKIISLHVDRTKVALNLHTMFRDANAYGIGIVTPQWITKHGKKMTTAPGGIFDQAGTFHEANRDRVVVDSILFEGNALHNIDPYNYLPDPNFPIHEVQRGEYVGWMDKSNYMDLLTEEQQDPDLFNIRYLRHVNNKSSALLGADSRSRGKYYQELKNRNISDPIDLFNIYVKLIPSAWNLGDADVPEKWLFTVAGDAVIIRARPLGLYHDLFPVAITAPDFDGYSPVAYSRLEILSGMQTTIDWLFNSHIANVRKAINDVLIVDPYLLNIEDLRDPEPGGIVRLRRPAWGRGVENVVKQLTIMDITRTNLQDVSFLINYMQQVAGTDNPVMGTLRQGGPERLSAREFQSTARGAVSRLERIAKIIGLQAMQDIGYFFAYHTQQLMSEDVYVRSIGEWPRIIQEQFSPSGNRVLATPKDITVDYDLIVRDGSIPGGNFSDAWIQLFQSIAGNEQLLQRFDIVRIFKYIATQLGAKNVDEFEIKQQPPPQIAPVVAPDETVQQQAQAGNIVPLMQGLGA